MLWAKPKDKIQSLQRHPALLTDAFIADVDECSSDPCQNGGTCTDEVAGYGLVAFVLKALQIALVFIWLLIWVNDFVISIYAYTSWKLSLSWCNTTFKVAQFSTNSKQPSLNILSQYYILQRSLNWILLYRGRLESELALFNFAATRLPNDLL